jgi:hypothetical protein
MIAVLERAKTVRALDRSATAIGFFLKWRKFYIKYLENLKTHEHTVAV